MIIEVSADNMSAQLIIPANYQAGMDEILCLLSEQAICFGIDEQAIKQACELCNTERKITVAKGQNPHESEDSGLKSCISSENELHVDEGQRVAYYQEHHASDGFDIFGNIIQAEHSDSKPLIGDGLEIRGENVFATQNGVLIIGNDGTWRVFTPDPSENPIACSAEIQISSDAMQARCSLNAHEYIDSGSLAEAVQSAGIIHGLEHHELRKAIQPLAADRVVIIARGTLPQNGSDAHLSYLINDQLSYDRDDIQNIDFRQVTNIKNVAEQQPLARLTPAQPGTPGMDVTGKKLPAEAGKHIELEDFMEEGVMLSPEDPLLIVASQAGIYKRDLNGKISVLPCLEINGDVDMSVGNIETPHPVIIHGDIKQGFTVKSESDIEVAGLIEDARVSAGGNITVSKGILPGKHRIKARGDIAALYIREREVKARNIIVSQSIRRCSIFASGDLEAQEVFGGETHINNFMIVETLGSPKGHRTSVKVGLDPYINALLSHAREQYHTAYNECQALKPKVLAASKRAQERALAFKDAKNNNQDNLLDPQLLQQQARRALDDSKQLSNAYADAHDRVQRFANALEHHRLQLRDQQHQSSLVISGTLYPPCKIQIGLDARYRVEKALHNVCLALDQNGHITISDQAN